MNDKLFAELAASIEEAGHIVREETAPSRTLHRGAQSLWT